MVTMSKNKAKNDCDTKTTEESTAVAVRDSSVAAMQIEIGYNGTPLFWGDWGFDILLDGEPLLPTGDWVEICCENEPEYICYEWEIPLVGGYRLERLLCFFSKEKIYLLGDALIPPKSQKVQLHDLQYVSRLEVSPLLKWKGNPHTRELHLFRKEDLTPSTASRPMGVAEQPAEAPTAWGTLMPLTLTSSKKGEAHQSIKVEKKQLILQQRFQGNAFFAPIAVAFSKKNQGKPVSWFPLTVGRNMKNVTGVEATGTRMVIGRQQYLIYRSFQDVVPRTVLGHHLVSDFFFAKFSKKGVESILDLGDIE